MGIDMDIIFQIAGIGIVVAFLHTILDQMGKKNTRTGLPYLALFIFCLWLPRLSRICFKKSNRSSFSRIEGGVARLKCFKLWD